MSDHEGPTEGRPPPDPSGPTQPIRPSQAGGEPIPERVRQPIFVPRPESTIAGLPRAFAVAAVVALVVALAGGFLIGRAVGGDGEPSEGTTVGRGGRCGKALTLSLQAVELQKQAVANRTQVAQAIALEDQGQVRELNSVYQTLAPAIQDAEARLETAVEKCRSGRGGRGKGDRRGGQGGGQGNA